MSNQHDGALRAACLAGAQQAKGLSTAEVPGYSRAQAGRMVQKLVATGHLFVAKISHRYARYFDTMGRAEAYLEAHHGKPYEGVTIKKSKAWSKEAPAVNPNGVKPQRIEHAPPRFAPDPKDKSWQVFSAMKPGQYLEAA